ncbi:MAG TPA: PIN domain-containing protein [Vicinamibacteria bacterium]
MTGPVFVDTNVLVYFRDARDKAKHERAREWLAFLWETRRGRVSRQVLHEYYVAVTRKLKPGLTEEEARSDVRALFLWLSALPPDAMIEAAWVLQDACSVSFWDALILAAAQAMGCDVVLSEDLPAGQEMEGMRIVNPSAVRPAGLAEP